MSVMIMIDGSIKRKRKLGFEIQSSGVTEKHYKIIWTRISNQKEHTVWSCYLSFNFF